MLYDQLRSGSFRGESLYAALYRETITPLVHTLLQGIGRHTDKANRRSHYNFFVNFREFEE